MGRACSQASDFLMEVVRIKKHASMAMHIVYQCELAEKLGPTSDSYSLTTAFLLMRMTSWDQPAILYTNWVSVTLSRGETTIGAGRALAPPLFSADQK